MFFDSPAVTRSVDAAARRNLSRGGAFIRRTARSSLRQAVKKTTSQLTEDEAKSLEIRDRIAKQKGKPKPKRPLAGARPGRPPRIRYAKSPLKSLLFFGYDASRRSVVVGSALFKSRSPTVPEALEFGVGVASHPYMGPAYAQNENAIQTMWRDSVRG